jgi:hypothetical protein
VSHITLAATAIASYSERDNGAALEPPPALAQSKDSRHEIEQQGQQKQRPHELINFTH